MARSGYVTHLFRTLFFLVCAWVLSACDGLDSDKNTVATERASVGGGGLARVQSRPCDYKVDWHYKIECGQLLTADGFFKLPYVVIKNQSSTHYEAPLLYLAGGPGGSGNLQQEGIQHWLAWFDRANIERDLVLIDRRGTGGSKPLQRCKQYWSFSREILSRNMSLEEELQQGGAVLKECLAGGQKSKFNSDHYGSDISAADMYALMQALDYSRWNIYGVSYGTRLALHLLKGAEADKIDSVILDSLYPAGQGSLDEWPALLHEATQALYAGCDQFVDCGGSAPHLENQLLLALGKLKQQPLKFSLPSWHGEAPFNIVLNDHRFLSMIFSSLYDRTTLMKIPAAIQGVLTGNRKSIKALLTPFINYAFDPEFNPLVFFTLECRESPPSSLESYASEVAKYPTFAAYTVDLAKYDICPQINLTPAEPLAQLDPNALKHPVLLLAGALDPITPAKWAQQMAARQASVTLAVFPEVGHSVVGSNDCAHGLLAPFLAGKLTPNQVQNCHSVH